MIPPTQNPAAPLFYALCGLAIPLIFGAVALSNLIGFPSRLLIGGQNKTARQHDAAKPRRV